MSKEECGNVFKQVLTKSGQGPNIANIHVFDEPHKKYNPQAFVSYSMDSRSHNIF